MPFSNGSASRSKRSERSFGVVVAAWPSGFAIGASIRGRLGDGTIAQRRFDPSGPGGGKIYEGRPAFRPYRERLGITMANGDGNNRRGRWQDFGLGGGSSQGKRNPWRFSLIYVVIGIIVLLFF